MLNRCLAAFVLVAALSLLPMTAGARPAKLRAAHVAATCDDYETQADAQRAADTRDADGDGIYCEDLPCPCSTEAGGGGERATGHPSCTKPSGVQRFVFEQEQVPEHPSSTSGSRSAGGGRGGYRQPPRR